MSRIVGGAAILLALAASCAPLDLRTGLAPGTRVELEQTPFYPQQDKECGPASLAMVLSASGVQVDPEALLPLTYLPGRQGSLQIELMAASRAWGRIPYEVDPTIQGIAVELQQGRPVLVLQNLGLQSLPAYHYGVVIGMEGSDTILLRSGTERRKKMDVARFLMSWKRPGSWGIVLLKPSELPANPEPDRYLRAVSAFEQSGQAEAAARAYDIAGRTWPDNVDVLFAAANNYLKRGKTRRAERRYARILAIDPEHVPAANNRAELMAARGCLRQAAVLIEAAVEQADAMQSPWLDAAVRTREDIARRLEKGAVGATVCSDRR